MKNSFTFNLGVFGPYLKAAWQCGTTSPGYYGTTSDLVLCPVSPVAHMAEWFGVVHGQTGSGRAPGCQGRGHMDLLWANETHTTPPMLWCSVAQTGSIDLTLDI